MRIRAMLVVTIALFFAITALTFHLLALFSKRWTVVIPRQPRRLNDHPHYYGLWTRCQYSNTSFVIPDISSQPNIENFVCRPNTYLRYDTTNIGISRRCYESRHQCSSIIGVHPDCRCQYLPVTQAQQWCACLAAFFLIAAICTLYLRVIATPQHAVAERILIFVPVISLGLALALIVTTLVLLGAYLRRNEYEDYDIRLPKDALGSVTIEPETVNYYRLNAFFKNNPDTNLRRQAISLFKSIHQERFRARLDWSAGNEIIAGVLTTFALVVSIFLALRQVQ